MSSVLAWLRTQAPGMDAYRDHSAIRIRNKYAAMHVARLRADGVPQTLPDAPFLHVFVARGEASLEGVGVLREGDAVRLVTPAGAQEIEVLSVSYPAPAGS